MIEFYGEVTDYTKRRTDKLRKRYMSNWIFVLAGVIVVIALIVLFTTTGFGWACSRCCWRRWDSFCGSVPCAKA